MSPLWYSMSRTVWDEWTWILQWLLVPIDRTELLPHVNCCHNIPVFLNVQSPQCYFTAFYRMLYHRNQSSKSKETLMLSFPRKNILLNFLFPMHTLMIQWQDVAFFLTKGRTYIHTTCTNQSTKQNYCWCHISEWNISVKNSLFHEQHTKMHLRWKEQGIQNLLGFDKQKNSHFLSFVSFNFTHCLILDNGSTRNTTHCCSRSSF